MISALRRRLGLDRQCWTAMLRGGRRGRDMQWRRWWGSDRQQRGTQLDTAVLFSGQSAARGDVQFLTWELTSNAKHLQYLSFWDASVGKQSHPGIGHCGEHITADLSRCKCFSRSVSTFTGLITLLTGRCAVETLAARCSGPHRVIIMRHDVMIT